MMHAEHGGHTARLPSLTQASSRILSDSKLLVLGIVQAFFDGAMMVWIVAYMAALVHVGVSEPAPSAWSVVRGHFP